MINIVITILGLIAVLGVLGIWVAWTNALFFGILGTIAIAIGAIVAIVLLTHHRSTER